MKDTEREAAATQPNKWLSENRARLLWQQPVRNIGVATCYSVGAAIAVVLRYTGGGWDILVPPSMDPDSDTTLKAASVILGIGR